MPPPVAVTALAGFVSAESVIWPWRARVRRFFFGIPANRRVSQSPRSRPAVVQLRLGALLSLNGGVL